PDFAGEYNCKISTTSPEGSQSLEAPVSFAVSDAGLTMSGAGSQTSDPMPCKNSTEDINQNGVTAKAVMSCSASVLGFDIKVSIPAQNIDVKTAMSFEKTSATQLKFVIDANGVNQGQSISAKIVGDCTKK
ncbi:MAG: hypothetical protein AABZ31_01330, partial [Bdellovibrionota bacterium]